MIGKLLGGGTAAALLLMTGCRMLPASGQPELIVERASEPVTVDGIASEAVWQRATAYPLLVPRDCGYGPECRQPGTVSFARDDRFLYVLAELADDDVVQEDDRNNRHLYETGDVIELFLWPAGKGYYWEVYAAPNGRHSMLFFPSTGRKIFLTAMQHDTRLRVGAAVDGTLNDWSDRDRGYTVEIAIPLEELTRYGDRFDESGDWRIMAARYNYSVNLPEIEYSATSLLPKTSFHLREEYSKLIFRKKPEKEQ